MCMCYKMVLTEERTLEFLSLVMRNIQKGAKRDNLRMHFICIELELPVVFVLRAHRIKLFFL